MIYIIRGRSWVCKGIWQKTHETKFKKVIGMDWRGCDFDGFNVDSDDAIHMSFINGLKR